MIRVILIVAITALLIWFLSNRKTSKMKAGKKLGVVVFFVFAVVTVLFPGITNDLAHHVGVGRGTDLLLYFFIIVFIAYVLNQYLHSKEEDQRIVALARKIAILEANQKNKKL